MRRRFDCSLLFMLVLAGCLSTPHGTRPPVSAPAPSSASPTVTPGTVWTFSFAPGLAVYRISRSAVIESTTDTTVQREISSNLTHESITLEFAGDTIAFGAMVDTFSTSTQGIIGTAQPVMLPLELRGSMASDSLIISNDSTPGCSPLMTVVVTDIHNLLPRLPASLSPNSSWRDSTDIAGCQGSIPTRSHSIHSYRTAGASTYEGIRVLVVQRADTIRANGAGAQQQHQLVLEASGIGSATYYLDAATGRVLHLTDNQNLTLTITASGRPRYFRQITKQEFVLIR